jgi:TetR/AcrR family transcriptional repressor of nem operon
MILIILKVKEPMRYAPQHKSETRRRIVASAARLFRAHGLDGVSVADVMAEAGLTHGGFYAHFASKDDLVAESLREGRGVSAAKLREAALRAPPGEGLAAAVGAYLSRGHRARRDQGCILAALGPEAGRDSPAARRALAQRSRDLAGALLPYLPDGSEAEREDTARAVTACLVGGLVLSRLEDDGPDGERMLAACRTFILEAIKKSRDTVTAKARGAAPHPAGALGP